MKKYISTSLISLFFALETMAQAESDYFITKWRTTTANESITIPIRK